MSATTATASVPAEVFDVVRAARAISELFEADANGLPMMRWFSSEEIERRSSALREALAALDARND